MATFKKIGILTSGGDAPGMSACVKAVVNKAHAMGLEVIGIQGGYAGLIKGELVNLDNIAVTNTVGLSGTFLYSSRCPEFQTEEGMSRAVEVCRQNGIDALICIGGDGTFRGATDMTLHGVPSIGLPGTIDNDITATDYTIGFDTAINTTVNMIDNLRDTCESHNRMLVVEVMGRHCGQIALYAAIATGAVGVVVPEADFDEAAFFEKVKALRAAGKRSMIVVVSEGAFNPDGSLYSETLVKKIGEVFGEEMNAKLVRFGHVVRGGKPTQKDRTIASEMGAKAVEMVMQGKSNIVMCELDGEVKPVDISLALIADRMYKNKLKDGDLDQFTPEQLEEIRAFNEKRKAEIDRLYRLAQDVAF